MKKRVRVLIAFLALLFVFSSLLSHALVFSASNMDVLPYNLENRDSGTIAPNIGYGPVRNGVENDLSFVEETTQETIEEISDVETTGPGMIELEPISTENLPKEEMPPDIESTLNPRSLPPYITSDGYIADGVYAFENSGNEGLWMDIQYNSTQAGYHVQQYAYGTASPTDSFTRSGLFKVTRVPNTNRYIIRLMLNNRLSFGFNGNEVITKVIPTDDSMVSINDTFYLTIDSLMRITIRPCNQNYTVAANNTLASGSAGAPDSYLTKLSMSSTEARGRWVPVLYTGETRSGVSLVISDLIAGKEGTSSPIGWTTLQGYNTLYSYITPVAPMTTSDIQGVWNDSTYTLTLTIHDEGRFNLFVQMKKGSTIYQIFGSERNAVLPFDEGMYFFINRENQTVADIEDATISSNALIEQYSFEGIRTQAWNIEHIVDGYYSIASEGSGSTVYYMGVEDDSTDANESVVLRSGTLTNGMMWKFSETSDDAYKVTAKTGEANNRVLCIGWAMIGFGQSNGIDIEQRNYEDDDDYIDEWYLARIHAISFIEREEQEKTNWCWAATAKMFAKNYGVNVSATQQEIVTQVKGSPIDDGGSLTDAATAINYCLSDAMYAQRQLFGRYYEIYSKELLKQFLIDGHVVYIAIGLYPINESNPIRLSGHASLIHGYITIGNQDWFLLQDPQQGWGHNSCIRSYNNIFNETDVRGFSDTYERKERNGVQVAYYWDQVLVVETNYANALSPFYYGS